jgi:hypothetical protein
VFRSKKTFIYYYFLLLEKQKEKIQIKAKKKLHWAQLLLLPLLLPPLLLLLPLWYSCRGLLGRYQCNKALVYNIKNTQNKHTTGSRCVASRACAAGTLLRLAPYCCWRHCCCHRRFEVLNGPTKTLVMV